MQQQPSVAQVSIQNSTQAAFGGRGFGRMVPAMLRLRWLPPSNLLLVHNSNTKSFSMMWTSGNASTPCKLQYYTGSTWADITSTVSNPYNCGATTPAWQGAILNGDGWKANWNGTQVRLVRLADDVPLGTFAQTLVCSSTAGSTGSTPTTDEDCNGVWDNTAQQQSCTNVQGCPAGQSCYKERNWDGSRSCSGGWETIGYYCLSYYPGGGCQPDPGWDNNYSSVWTADVLANCSYQTCSQVTYYY